MKDDRLVQASLLDEDDQIVEVKLRPRELNDYVGQEKVKEKLRVFLEAAQVRNEAVEHILLSGPPGLGKTTLAHIVAQEMKTSLHAVTGPNVEKKRGSGCHSL